ncbi:MAG: hypothetical protein IJA10_09985 [Lachnospiraceae bacterium]|nr:hypothetical protein [Lachnospiraceae bacterium]
MSSLQEYIEELKKKYNDKVNAVPSEYDEEMLALVPDAIKEFYRTYESIELPFGEIDRIEVAVKHSEAEPFKSEGWFCFGFDGYFSFWLCKLEPDKEKLSFTYWDHESGCEIDEPIYENLTEFLKEMQEEYEENNDEWDEEF